jgi:hypothetical protein
MKSKKFDSGPHQLPDPYDLKEQVKKWKANKFETDYGIAWMSDGQLKHRLQKRGMAASDITSTHFTKCILVNKGAGWNVAESKHVKAHLLSLPSPDPALDNPNVPDQNLEEWLKFRRDEIESWILEACNASPHFAAAWATKAEAERTNDRNAFKQSIFQHRFMYATIFEATEALLDIDRLSLKYQRKRKMSCESLEGKSPLMALAEFHKPRNANCTEDFLQGVKAGYAAGIMCLGLRAKIANERSMKMAIQSGSGKKPEERTHWIREQLEILERKLGRKAKIKEILDHIDDKTDPVSKERIWIHTLPGDDEKSIQWSDSESWALKRFRDRIRRIRKK